MKQQNQIAYLGLGIMGGEMAAHLARAGHNVFGWNRTPGRPGVAIANTAGATITDTAQEAVGKADFVFLCLSDVQDIEHMLNPAGPVIAAAKPGTVFIDMSTTGPDCARRLYEQLKLRNLHFLDAPVSGGDVGAKNATLTIMVGGDKEVFDLSAPLFQCLGKSVTYCGPSGSGQAVKLCNQILCAVNMVAVTEALHFADLVGVDPKLVVDVCSTGAGGSWALANLGPKIVQGDFAPGFMLKHMLKDLRLVEESLELEANTLLGTTVATVKFRQAANLDGVEGEDQGTQAMISAYQQE